LKKVLIFLAFAVLLLTLEAQHFSSGHSARYYLDKKGEVYFTFSIPEKDVFTDLLNVVSVDNIVDGKVYAYANENEYNVFVEKDIHYTVLKHPGDVDFDLNMKTIEQIRKRDLTENWDFYPTYEAYVDLMYQFEDDFPGMVEIKNIGETVMGRDLLFAKISPQVELQRPVPQFMYTSTMHGDETAGFILSLRLIHYLLDNYGQNEEITHLMDSVEIWICPNENPDGTYTDDNSTVQGATRGNANSVDLNRNYPNPVSDPVNPQQPETTAMIEFADTMNFIMSANMHGGVELVNFPFDSWHSWENPHADHDWWEFVMHEYVDTVHKYSPPGYMTGQGGGVTHGGDWYVIYGSRQDYFNYYRSCREFTLELSNQKLLDPELLPDHWDYNYRSFLNYIRQSKYGVHGLVYDNQTGQPLNAKVSLPGYDSNNSEINTSMPFGNYNRQLLEGSYNMSFVSDGYPTVTINGIEAANYHTKYLNIALGENVSENITTVNINKQGEGEVEPFTGTQFFNKGANVFLNAYPSQLWEFDKWIINGELYYEPQLIYTLSQDVQITARFKESDMLPEITVTPESIEFGTGIIGNTYIEEFSIENTGTDSLIIYAINLEGEDVFYLKDPAKYDEYIIKPGEEEIIELFFQPFEEKDYSANLIIECNDPVTPEIEVPVSGKGVEEAPAISLSTDTIYFGKVNTGDYKDSIFTIINSGSLPLIIEDIDMDGNEQFVINKDFPVTIEPENKKDITVTFSPEVEGEYKTTAVVINNGYNNPKAELLLYGNATDPAFVYETLTQQYSLKVFPNPITDKSKVIIKTYDAVKANLELYDLQGNLVKRVFQGYIEVGEHRLSLLSLYNDLQPGVYILLLSDGKTSISRRIIKTN